ncbi:hypothetical protein Syun_006949 [Stephania yunnanensis]|uniref:Uncharacterized protein n=1 Tax=Stephania yunnanensis TaxID=152371 RepID=A0AAP0KZ14_9MAGN
MSFSGPQYSALLYSGMLEWKYTRTKASSNSGYLWNRPLRLSKEYKSLLNSKLISFVILLVSMCPRFPITTIRSSGDFSLSVLPFPRPNLAAKWKVLKCKSDEIKGITELPSRNGKFERSFCSGNKLERDDVAKSIQCYMKEGGFQRKLLKALDLAEKLSDLKEKLVDLEEISPDLEEKPVDLEDISLDLNGFDEFVEPLFPLNPSHGVPLVLRRSCSIAVTKQVV